MGGAEAGGSLRLVHRGELGLVQGGVCRRRLGLV